MSLPGAESEPHEFEHDLSDGEELDDGWVKMEIDLEDYEELTAVDQVGIHNNEPDQEGGNEILLTDIYFDID